jgi:hypothetical protein
MEGDSEMNDVLREYLDDPYLARKVHVAEDEAPEPMIAIYVALDRAIRKGGTIIEVTDEELRIRKQINGSITHRLEFPTGELDTPSTMRRYFDSVLSRDEVINSNLELIQETEEMAVYRIL